MTNTATRAPEPGGIQKIFVLNSFRWSATVSFAGVAKYGSINVAEWLAKNMHDVGPNDPFDRLMEQLLKAESWLRFVPPPYNKHSFSVGAFIGSQPRFVLVSNFEQPSGLADAVAAQSLTVYERQPASVKAFIAGEKFAVSRPVRRRLEALARTDPDSQRMCAALAEANREVAASHPTVSKSCYTSHLRLTGEGGGYTHEIGNEPYVPTYSPGIPTFAEEAIRKLIESHFGPGRGRIVSMSMMRSASTEEDHNLQLREKPNDPNVHNNYGAFLKDKKKDNEGAERAYGKALELDPHHTNALGNLANLLAEQGDSERAATLYQRALRASPGHENVSWNYSRFLVREHHDDITAIKVIDEALAKHPQSGRLYLLRAERRLTTRDFDGALVDYIKAREHRADQKQVEAGIAFALHLKDAPIDECIDAYRTAIALSPEQGALKLNLSQLLFIKGYAEEAGRMLHEALQSQIDDSACLEGQFYRLAHTSDPVEDVTRTITVLLQRGARLRWDVSRNIDVVRTLDPDRASKLELVAEIMAGERDLELLSANVKSMRT